MDNIELDGATLILMDSSSISSSSPSSSSPSTATTTSTTLVDMLARGGGAAAGGLSERRLRPPHDLSLKCPRCDSANTKFCYYNNYSLTQPRYFCKTCRRYWTKGGTLRNIPVGGGCRKNKNNNNNKHPAPLLLTNNNNNINTPPSPLPPGPTDLHLSSSSSMHFAVNFMADHHPSFTAAGSGRYNNNNNIGMMIGNPHPYHHDEIETCLFEQAAAYNTDHNSRSYDFMAGNAHDHMDMGFNNIGLGMINNNNNNNNGMMMMMGLGPNFHALPFDHHHHHHDIINNTSNNFIQSNTHTTTNNNNLVVEVKPNPNNKQILALGWQHHFDDVGGVGGGYINAAGSTAAMGSSNWPTFINGSNSSSSNPIV